MFNHTMTIRLSLMPPLHHLSCLAGWGGGGLSPVAAATLSTHLTISSFDNSSNYLINSIYVIYILSTWAMFLRILESWGSKPASFGLSMSEIIIWYVVFCSSFGGFRNTVDDTTPFSLKLWILKIKKKTLQACRTPLCSNSAHFTVGQHWKQFNCS